LRFCNLDEMPVSRPRFTPNLSKWKKNKEIVKLYSNGLSLSVKQKQPKKHMRQTKRNEAKSKFSALVRLQGVEDHNG
jgi:hypothetical protein